MYKAYNLQSLPEMPIEGRARILVAEGDKDARAAIMWCLLSEGFWVDPVANGFDAAVALEAPEPPDLAVIDLGLQGFDGRRLMEGMRASDRLRRVPLIATGFTDPYAPLPAGVAFMRKPMDLPRLLLTVGGLLQDQRGHFSPRRAPRPAHPGERMLLRRAAKRDA